jgi:hypothetical protein
MKKIKAKFNSKCSATNTPIKKGETIWYDPTNKKVYKDGNQPEINHDALHVQAQEDAFFDNWYAKNY